jgi:D-serine dehydratase
MSLGLPHADDLVLDDRIRGVPPGTMALDAKELAAKNWHPAEGIMALPVLTLDEPAFAGNTRLMLGYARAQGVEIAPHAKTPMSPHLAKYLLDHGAWGTTVADIRQAAVMLRAGLNRLIIANEIGGPGGAHRLAALSAAWPGTDLYVFVDSIAAIEALASAWSARAALSPLKVLVEVGAGRAGARTLAAATGLIGAVAASEGRLLLAGVATYEGAATQGTPAATDAAITGLSGLTTEVMASVRAHLGPARPMLVTAGGSAYFDRVVELLKPAIVADPAATLVLRSGAIFIHDHGIYDRALAAIDARGGFAAAEGVGSARQQFRPALRIWAEILSRPTEDLAICGMGMRDVSFDQGLPMALNLYRQGEIVASAPGDGVTRLNDQHAFLTVRQGEDLRVGDVVEFGISHPCTCLDRYRVIFGTDGHGRVRSAYPTYFG